MCEWMHVFVYLSTSRPYFPFVAWKRFYLAMIQSTRFLFSRVFFFLTFFLSFTHTLSMFFRFEVWKWKIFFFLITFGDLLWSILSYSNVEICASENRSTSNAQNRNAFECIFQAFEKSNWFIFLLFLLTCMFCSCRARMCVMIDLGTFSVNSNISWANTLRRTDSFLHRSFFFYPLPCTQKMQTEIGLNKKFNSRSFEKKSVSLMFI